MDPAGGPDDQHWIARSMSVGELATAMPIETIAQVVLFQAWHGDFDWDRTVSTSLIDSDCIVESCALCGLIRCQTLASGAVFQQASHLLLAGRAGGVPPHIPMTR